MTEEQNSYRTQFPEPDWHEVAEQASKESDPRKLSYLIQALCDRLEELQNERKRSRRDGAGDGGSGAND